MAQLNFQITPLSENKQKSKNSQLNFHLFKVRGFFKFSCINLWSGRLEYLVRAQYTSIVSQEKIEEVGIDLDGKFYIKPDTGEFEFVYRAALGIYWDKTNKSLKFLDAKGVGLRECFEQIIAAVKSEYGIQLKITSETKWNEVPGELKKELLG
jgi:hypothetical protein